VIKERNFLFLAILVSLAWHLAWGSLVGISFGPVHAGHAKFGEINFLGPLIEKAAFEGAVVKARAKSEASDMPASLAEYEARLDREGTARMSARYEFTDTPKKDAMRPYTEPEREKLIGPLKKGIFYNVGGIDRSIEGPLRDRRIIYRPLLPDSVKIFVNENDVVLTRLKIKVNAEGYVQTVVPVILSGDPRIDTECAADLKQWKFIPVQPGGREEDWGIVTFFIKG